MPELVTYVTKYNEEHKKDKKPPIVLVGTKQDLWKDSTDPEKVRARARTHTHTHTHTPRAVATSFVVRRSPFDVRRTVCRFHWLLLRLLLLLARRVGVG